MTATEKDPYDVLGISMGATQEEIKGAYRALVRRYHPDSSSEDASTERFQEIHVAYEVLSDPERRRAHDRWRAERRDTGRRAFTWDVLVSGDQLPVLEEEQMLYALVIIKPAHEAKRERLPLNLTLVIDRSTSMKGNRLDYVKAAAHKIIDELNEQDTLGVVAFSDRAEVVVPSQPLDDNRNRIHARISAIWTSGGTEILQGLQTGLEQVDKFHEDDTISHVVLLTDGQTYGDEEECIAATRRAGLRGISVSALGIGEDWNDVLLEEMTRQTGGTCSYISHPRQIRHALRRYVQGLSAIVAQDLQLTLRFSEGAWLDEAFRCLPSIERLSPQQDAISLGLLRGDSRIQVLLEIVAEPGLEGRRRLVQLELSGSIPGSDQRERLVFDLETEFVKDPEEKPVPMAIVNVLNRVCLVRIQEQAWLALEDGRGEEASLRLEAAATRLFELGEEDLARVALLEAGRVAKGGRASGKGHKTIKYGTRRLGMEGVAMIECPSCGKKHRPGTLFCTECGIYLPTGGTLRTTPLRTDQLPQSPTAPQEALAPDEEGQLQPAHSVLVEVVDSDRQTQLPTTSELLLGRKDVAHGIFPDLDLTADGGLQKGVSRRHAKIFQREGKFYIEDVGSANGTFLNDQRLTPYLPYQLKEENEIQLGQVRLVVILQ
jgi:Ca-activated chloride channel family protein